MLRKTKNIIKIKIILIIKIQHYIIHALIKFLNLKKTWVGAFISELALNINKLKIADYSNEE
ncbi:hypothetical protein SZ52_01175 [Brachyspira hyodysenteriae]|nr:hypothetical protein SZ52_01175 [Brachyspira hyodysenteriae]